MRKSIPSSGGNPVMDNHRRLNERKLNRLVSNGLRIRTPHGRRRKKYLTITVSAEYKALVIAVAKDLKNRSK